MSSAAAVDATLHQLISSLTSSDNAVRSQAERSLAENFVNPRPEYTLNSLVAILRSEPNDEARAFISILIRRLALQQTSVVNDQGESEYSAARITRFSKEGLDVFCNGILLALSSEKNHGTRKKIAFCVSDVARNLSHQNFVFANLKEFLFQCVQAPSTEFREIGFFIIMSMPLLILNPNDNNFDIAFSVFSNSLEVQESLETRLSAMKALVSFISEAFTPKTVKTQGQVVAKLMMKCCGVLPPLLNPETVDELESALSTLIDLAVDMPTTFQSVCNQLFEFSISIVSNENFDSSVRNLALELQLTLLEEARMMIRKNVPQFAEKLFPVCLNMMTMIDEEQTEPWGAVDDLDDSDAEPSDEDPHIVGEQSMDRLSRGIGAKIINPLVFHHVPEYLRSPNWRCRHAALLAISATAEGCKNQMRKHLAVLINAVAQTVNDDHPRVRYALCNCLGQLCTDFNPDIQQKFHAEILSALLKCVGCVGHPRVQSQGAAALINFCENVDTRIIEAYLPSIFKALGELFSSEKIYVQGSAIVSISVLAETCKAAFAPYASVLLPHLFNIMRQPNEKRLQSIRGKAIDCATMIAVVVPRKVLGQSLDELLAILCTIQSEVKETDDPQWRNLMQGWSRIAEVIGAEFVPFLPIIIEPLLVSAGLEDEIVFVTDKEELVNFPSEEGWDISQTSEGSFACVRTASTDDRETALDTCESYARTLGFYFAPYVSRVFEIVLPVIKLDLSESVRATAVSIVPSLFRALDPSNLPTDEDGAVVSVPAALAAASEKVDPAIILDLWARFCNALFEIFRNDEDEDIEFLHNALTALQDTIFIMDKRIPEQEVPLLVNFYHKKLVEYIEAVENLCDDDFEENTNDLDLEDEALDSEEEITIKHLPLTLSSVIASILKVFGPSSLGLFENTIQSAAYGLSNSRMPLIRFGIQFLVDLIDSAGLHSLKYFPAFGPKLVDAILNQSVFVAQNASYAIGLAAQNAGSLAREICAAALPNLVAVVKHPLAMDEERVCITENALSAIGKIVWFCKESFTDDNQRNECLMMFIMGQPIVHDGAEAISSMEKLCDLIEGNHASVINNALHVVKAFISVLGDNILEDAPELEARSASNLIKMMELLNADERQSVISQLNPEQHMTLSRIGLLNGSS